ncbi:hypothetical protein SAMN05421505_1426 [Sinosporangium album]|uniref:Uncharacterized protein n=1 Tax=Sinosporangium album TaxID=504805 RepID=A0A1G8J9B6_9ACTN|nr:hypothetical protein [Sinosporangium album]SDI27825.1 hypothetical protein SAMN05421505_1426 [Sinosporangium album]
MEKVAPPWAVSLFGEEDADRIAEAVIMSLLATENAMLNTHAQAESTLQFAAAGARMTNQFDQLVKHVNALEIPNTHIVERLRVWYKLVVVHNVLLFPYRDDTKERAKPGARWPKKVTHIVKELFTFSPASSWEAPTLDGMEDNEKIEVREALARLAPTPQLVLIPYVMNLSGVQQAWWGQAALLTDSGELEWVGEPASLLPAGKAKSTDASNQSANFDTGDLPEAEIRLRPEADRKRNVPPITERESAEADTTENNEG